MELMPSFSCRTWTRFGPSPGIAVSAASVDGVRASTSFERLETTGLADLLDLAGEIVADARAAR